MRVLAGLLCVAAALAAAAWRFGWLDSVLAPAPGHAPAVAAETSWRRCGPEGFSDAQFAEAMEHTNPAGVVLHDYLLGPDDRNTRLGPEGLLWRRHPATGRWVPIDPAWDCAMPR